MPFPSDSLPWICYRVLELSLCQGLSDPICKVEGRGHYVDSVSVHKAQLLEGTVQSTLPYPFATSQDHVHIWKSCEADRQSRMLEEPLAMEEHPQAGLLFQNRGQLEDGARAHSLSSPGSTWSSTSGFHFLLQCRHRMLFCG